MTLPELQTITARQKSTWEAGDFGEIARTIQPVAEEFMARLPLNPGMRVLDVACGSGNLALIAARRGCRVRGVDLASNLVKQARERASREELDIEFLEGNAESLPYEDGCFDAVVSMFGAMFTPRPLVVSSEMYRVVRPGGFVAMANWTPEGFIGKMFEVFKRHLPPTNGLPSVMLWGHEPAVFERLKLFNQVITERRLAAMRYPFSPEETVDFFRRYYGPTVKAFESLDAQAQSKLRRELIELQTVHNTASLPGATEALAEYLEVIAFRG